MKAQTSERQKNMDHHADFQTLAKEAEAQADWKAAARWYSQAMEQRSAELALINRVQEGLSSKLELQAIYDLVGDNLRDLFTAQVVMISEYDPLTNRIFHHFAIERGQHLHIPGWHPIDSSRLEIVRTSRPLMINLEEISNLLNAEKMHIIPGTGVPKTWLGVPILVKDEVKGVISLQNLDKENAFSASDIDLLTTLANSMSMSLENARLLADMQNRLAQLAALQETNQAMVSTLDQNALLKLIIQQAATLLHADGALLNLVDWKKQEDEVVACIGTAGGALGVKFPLNQSLSGWVTLHNQPEISNHVREDPRAKHGGVALFQKQPLNAAITPLSIKDHVIGTLAVMDKLGGAADFDQADLDLLVGFANQAATAIENARLYKAEQRRGEQFRVIAEVGRKIITATAVDELLHQMAQLIQASFGYYHVGIGLIEGQEVVSKAEVGAYEAVYRNTHIPVGHSSWGWVAQHGEVLLQSDVNNDSHFYPGPGMQAIRSHICVPLQTKDAVIGVLSAASSQLNAFDGSDQMVLQSLAQQAAVAIENIRFYQRAQQMAVMEERSRLARELHDAVTQTLFSASLIAEAVPSAWEKDPQQGRELLQELRGLSRGALAEMRTLLLELRPAALVETHMEDLLRQLGEAASGREGIPVNVILEGKGTLPPEVHVAMYRIAQEALNNVVKHARASQVSIRLCFACKDQAEVHQAHSLKVLLSIIDNGRGFDITQAPHHRLGLGIMQERAQAIGANLVIDSRPGGGGTRVTVLWEQGSAGEGK